MRATTVAGVPAGFIDTGTSPDKSKWRCKHGALSLVWNVTVNTKKSGLYPRCQFSEGEIWVLDMLSWIRRLEVRRLPDAELKLFLRKISIR